MHQNQTKNGLDNIRIWFNKLNLSKKDQVH